MAAAQIIQWADDHHKRFGEWPSKKSGQIATAPGRTWARIDHALYRGRCGLPSGMTLKRLLHERRGTLYPSLRKNELTIGQILAWADDHHRRTGHWPTARSGVVATNPSETWTSIDRALADGRRVAKSPVTEAFARRGESMSLPRLLRQERKVLRSVHRGTPLSQGQILSWADAYRRKTGEWPTSKSGTIPQSPDDDTWSSVNRALNEGKRGLPARGSLALLLQDSGRQRHVGRPPPVTVEQVLRWADQHHARTGKWPTTSDRAIPSSLGETWMSVSKALARGSRGLPKTPLALLLTERRGIRRKRFLPKLTEEQVLQFVGDHLARTGKWPHLKSGRIPNTRGESWYAINDTLAIGHRGLRDYKSLADFLTKHFGSSTGSFRAGRFRIALPYRSAKFAARLTESKIVEWAMAHRQKTGEWPGIKSGPIVAAPGETWEHIHRALLAGSRGLRAQTSLADFLEERVGRRNRARLPDLSAKQILQWADEHRARTGRWPTRTDGEIPGSNGETWGGITVAAQVGIRGLPGTWSLADLLVNERGKRKHLHRARLNPSIIRQWVIRHYERTGRWPSHAAGDIHNTDGETWTGVHSALVRGTRGLHGRSSLAQFTHALREEIAARRKILKVQDILLWAKAHFRRHGEWPDRDSGRIPDAPGESWRRINDALRHGQRGIKVRTNLPLLLADQPKPPPIKRHPLRIP
ncbi:MAG TPA: hypothetical protein VNT79_13090 [Phycisphaerae bacterium]|nr:hypothetical protein [Phycisphaerae bacterium]